YTGRVGLGGWFNSRLPQKAGSWIRSSSTSSCCALGRRSAHLLSAPSALALSTFGNVRGRVTALEAPHRIADAILRDSLLGKTPFRESAPGKRFAEARVENATGMFEVCPTALLFGVWDSTGAAGGLGNKFARALVSEIVGIHAVPGVRTSSRVDPLGIEKCP